jgi:hypothetical protein
LTTRRTGTGPLESTYDVDLSLAIGVHTLVGVDW